ncbi:MAG: MFS transporter [Actinomycetales bacterium]|nr:MFS transporter [Actinomycetales bacterium]
MSGRSQRGPLRHTDFRWFFFGETINTAGSSMSPLALAFAVLHIDNSPTALGLVVASWTVPMVGFMLIGGALADRLPRALVLRGCNLIEGAVQLTSAVLVLTGTAQIWHLIVLQFIGGTAVAVSYPAFHGMVPILLPEADRKAAYLLLSQAQSALQVLGPTVAGIIVAVSSPGWALLVDAATFFVAAIFLSLLRLPPNDRPDAGESVLEDFRAGWSFARTLGWVLPVASLSLVFNAVVSGAVGGAGPGHRQSHGRCGRLGARTVSGSPRLFGFAFVLSRVTIRRPLLAAQYGFLATAAPMVALAFAAQVLPLSAAFVISGCGVCLINLAWNLTVQEKVPEAMLSRIMAIDGFFGFVAMPIGQVAVGPVSAWFGSQDVQLGAAAIVVVTFVIGATRPAIRRVRLHGPGRAGGG